MEVPSLQWKVTPNISCEVSGVFLSVYVSSGLWALFAFPPATACSKLLLSAQASAALLPGPFGSRLDTILFSPALAAKPSQIPLTYAYGGLQAIITTALLSRLIRECLVFCTTRNFSFGHDLALGLTVPPNCRNSSPSHISPLLSFRLSPEWLAGNSQFLFLSYIQQFGLLCFTLFFLCP